MGFLIRVIVNALALWVASWLLPGLDIEAGAAAEAAGGNQTAGIILAYLFIGLIFGLVNALVRPVVAFLALPLTVLTLGIFTIIINAAMLMLTAWISGYTPVHFEVDSFFWTAVLGALIISVVSLVANVFTGGRR
ncbi:phage holin family protein [Arthrobacter mobilis]|uniref:Phage holin family protein n=1 Tax=Arthrobacter mobilis TaxID=2724944 RepID=A0A7X6HEH3_9MICC|nr:phage holin family protein [Arthrobacter mobilis]NKX55677.1 phage holin family protein [Arthrobacter mobilis]